MSNGLIAGGNAGNKADTHVTSRPRILNKVKQYLIREVGNHLSLPTYHKWLSAQFMTLDWSKQIKAEDIGEKCIHLSVRLLFVHFGDIPAECIARIVGDDQTILYERPSEAAPHAPAIQADFRASGDRFMRNLTEKSLTHAVCSCKSRQEV